MLHILALVCAAATIVASIIIISGIIYNIFFNKTIRIDFHEPQRGGFFTGTCAQPPDPILRGPYPASPSWDGLLDTTEDALVDRSLKYNTPLGSY